MKSRSNTTVIILLVLDILLAASLLTGALFLRHSSPYQIKKQMNLGVGFLDDLNYEEAILHFQKAIDIDPKQVQPHVNLINTYNRYAESMAKESPAKAISIYDNMIKSFQQMETDLADVNSSASGESQSSTISKVQFSAFDSQQNMNFPDRLDYAIASIYSRQAELAVSAGLDPTDYENKSLEAYQKLLTSDANAENRDLTNKVATLLEKENRYLDVKVEEDARYYDHGISRPDWDPDTVYYDITKHDYQKVVLSDDDRKAFPNLADALDQVNQQNAAIRDASYTNTPDAYYDAYTNLTRADTTVVSFVNIPSQTLQSKKTVHNLDPLTGKELTLDDVVKNVSGLKDAILETASTDGSITNENLQRIIAEIDASNVPFTITEKGLYFPYERSGMYFNDPGGDVLVYFDQHPELFKDPFLQKKKEYMFEADEGIAFPDDIDEDGTDETITIDPITGSMYGEDKLLGFRLTIDGNVIEHMMTHETDSYEAYGFSSLYVAHIGGHCFLYVSVYGLDDYTETREYMLTKTSVQYIDILDSILRAGCNPNEVFMEHWTELLGTGSFGRYCSLSPDHGSPIPGNDTNFYYKYSYLKPPIFLKAAMDFDTVDEAGNIGQKKTVPAGTKLYLYRGDSEATYRDLRTEDGTLLRVKADKTSDWPYTINGVDVDQIFNNLQYAG